MQEFLTGIDVGSTTVKTLVRSAITGETLFRDYRRHESRLATEVLHVLQKVHAELGIAESHIRLFMTGSGGQQLSEILGARFVQEVAAVSLAVETFYPEVRSVVELGGQDAKMVFFQDAGRPGARKKIATMNDKCAGGTGVVIEKIAAKLHVPYDALLTEAYETARIYPVAGKCGVFAETDITGLQKQGVPAEDLIASLFHAIVLQNLSVLTRGNTFMPTVFLLGGPCAYFPGLQMAWRRGLLDLWRRKGVTLPDGAQAVECVVVPPQAEYFAAMGAIQFGIAESENPVPFKGLHALETHIRNADESRTRSSGRGGLWVSKSELEKFRKCYSLAPACAPARSDIGVEVFVGLDGGSTSTKAVALSRGGEVLASSYRLSESDPITDAVTVLQDLHGKLEWFGPRLRVLGLATTGYSKDLLKKSLSADLALVETVAHAKSSLRLNPNVDAIIDIGGQDIKIIVLRNGVVKDFRLNTQCSAGNGYFLQAAAESIGIRVEDFADAAFRAQRIPQFSYGCAVFLQGDIVNFQRQGWQAEEILAGLATVLPKNVFLYVAGVANVATLGRRFILQGGTQKNLAVVKAEFDYIREHYHSSGEPEIAVHPNCSEAGAIGAALQIAENYRSGFRTRFPGFDSLGDLTYTIHKDETTRCHYCTNRCLRTFVEFRSSLADAEPSKRVIVATCQRGEAESDDVVQAINRSWKSQRTNCPNFVQLAAEQAWLSMHPASADTNHRNRLNLFSSGRAEKRKALRVQKRIGIPKVLNLFTYAPLFSAYFESLGIPAENLRYSHFSTPERYNDASGFSAVDPCFPSKITIAHVYELLQSAKTKPLDAIFFPMFDVLTTPLQGCVGSNACPSGSATPEAVKAAFSRKVDKFREAGIEYVNPVLNMEDRVLFKYQMFEAWKDLLQLDWDENVHAIDIAFTAWETFEGTLRHQAQLTLGQLERQGRVGLVMLGRPYHHDPGLNQGILEELHRLGYPIFSQSLLPLEPNLLNRLFGEEVRAGLIASPLDISDIWKHTFSTSSNHKLWAAKFTARHPNLISVELSNFKCGHDAFIGRVIEQIIEQSGKPHFSFRDLDENRPLASVRIRIETMDYFLRHYREQLHIDSVNPPNAEHRIDTRPILAYPIDAPEQGWSIS